MNWDKRLTHPPTWALKTIRAGRLKGSSDIKPQWRYIAMTEVFGLCGEGWYFDVNKLWTEPGPDGQVFAFADINLFTKNESGRWNKPIPGIGGNMLIQREKDKETGGYKFHANDEAYKMAVTDALSTAMKMVGVASAVYEGSWDGSKYKDQPPDTPEFISAEQVEAINLLIDDSKADSVRFLKFMDAKTVDTIVKSDYKKAVAALDAKMKEAK